MPITAGQVELRPTTRLGEPPQPQTTSYGVALGQGGTITLTFPQPITNGPGPDFAVFGNGFTVSSSASWIKPAFVEVSSDGVNFFPFPAVSLTSTATQVSSFGELDPTDLHDLAGKDPVGYGTPFDLSELVGVSPLLNVNDVTAVRIVNCVGDIDPPYATYDSQGNIVNCAVAGILGGRFRRIRPGRRGRAQCRARTGHVFLGDRGRRDRSSLDSAPPDRRTLARISNFKYFKYFKSQISEHSISFNHPTTSWRLLSMRTSKTSCLCLLAALALGLGYFSGHARGSTTVDFSDLSLPAQSEWWGPDSGGTAGTLYGDQATYGKFTSGGAAFQNVYAVDPEYGPYWEGFAYSNVVNTTTPDYTNQFASITGGGINGEGSNYAVAYYDPYTVTPTIVLPATPGSSRGGRQHDLRLLLHARWRWLRRHRVFHYRFVSTFDPRLRGQRPAHGRGRRQPGVRRRYHSWLPVDLAGLGTERQVARVLPDLDAARHANVLCAGRVDRRARAIDLRATGAGALAALIAWPKRKSK